MKAKISEARLNDICYMILKRYLFEPCYGEGACPRECDIRICMDMSAPERITSITNAILSPNEKSGKSHTIQYEVDLDHVLAVTVDYIEDHWLKQSIDEVFGPGSIESLKKDFFEGVLPTCLSIPEDQCAD